MPQMTISGGANYFEQQDNENFGVSGQEPFVICPSSLLGGLSQQQLAAQQQLYQTAIEKVRVQVEQRKAQWWSSDAIFFAFPRMQSKAYIEFCMTWMCASVSLRL